MLRVDCRYYRHLANGGEVTVLALTSLSTRSHGAYLYCRAFHQP